MVLVTQGSRGLLWDVSGDGIRFVPLLVGSGVLSTLTTDVAACWECGSGDLVSQVFDA